MRLYIKILLFITMSLPVVCFSLNPEKKWKEKLVKQRQLHKVDLDQSILIASNIIDNCKNDSIRAVSYYVRGITYSNKGEYIKAFNDALEAKKMFDLKKDNLHDIVYNNISLSNIYKRVGLTERASIELDETLNIINKKDPNNNLLIGAVYISKANVSHNKNKPEESIFFFFEAEKHLNEVTVSESIKEKNELLSIVYSDISNHYLENKDYTKAEEYINKSMDIFGEKPTEVDYINTITLAEIFTETNREKEAIKLLLPLKNKANIEPVFEHFIYELLSKSYMNLGDLENSRKSQEQVNLIESEFSKQKSEGLNEVYGYIENELENIRVEKIKIKGILFSAVITSILIIIIVVRTYRNRMKLQKKIYHDLLNSIENNDKKVVVEDKAIKDIKYNNSELLLLEKLEKFEVEKGFLKKNLTLAVFAVELETNTNYFR